jgi:hypothetical protein
VHAKSIRGIRGKKLFFSNAEYFVVLIQISENPFEKNVNICAEKEIFFHVLLLEPLLLVPIRKRYFCPISRSLASSLTLLYEKKYPGNIRPVVNFSVCLDLEEKTSFLYGHYLS